MTYPYQTANEEYEILWDRYCDAVFAGTVE